MTSCDLVHQVGNNSVYHVRCFTCIHCQRRLSSKALYVIDDQRRIICKDCCLAGIYQQVTCCDAVTEPGVCKWGVLCTRNTRLIYWRPFTSAVRTSLAGSTGALPPQKNIEFGLDEVIEVQFPAVLRGLLALFGLFYCRSSIKFLPHLHSTSLSLFLCKFGGITRPIFSKNGEVRSPRLDPPVYLSSTFTN